MRLNTTWFLSVSMNIISEKKTRLKARLACLMKPKRMVVYTMQFFQLKHHFYQNIVLFTLNRKKKEAFKRKFKLNILHQASYIFHFPLEATTNATHFPSVYGYNHTKHAISKKGSKPNFMWIQIEKTVEIEQHRRITRQQ